MNIPTGTVTFLFTDIEGSTKLSQQFPETLQSALDRHHLIMQDGIESNNGFVFDIAGDAFCCAFQKAEDAVKAASEIQLNLANEKWSDAVIKVRMGIHSGNAEWNGKTYMGYITLARTARVMSAAYGGQILVTEKVHELTERKTVTGTSFRDLGERRLKDLIQPVKLFQILSTGLTADFPPLKTLDARPNNLPVQLTNFIGREKEIAEIKNLLSEFRHITLLGPGGTGKTRLSLQVAADLIDEFSNGVWIIELAPLFDPLLIPSTFIRTLGITEPPGQDTWSTLVNYLKDKEILLILDNSEHLINACANITEKLLKNCSGLKIIVTSREALRSDGEFTYRVTSLRHPQPKETNTLLELSQFEAVRLFIERALAVNSGFRVNNENAPALAEICYQLDGIPLAIELAAARIKILSVEKICEKLNDRFKLLTSGKRTALPRQQTLRAMIDWSYDLLSDKEKILFQRLSVFSGGWSLEAAEEVCSDDNVESYEIIDTHTNLLDKSLISSTETSGNIRFYMLESLKQYAIEKLGIDSETDVKHLNYFMKLADHEQMRNNGMEVIEWIKLIESEIDNIRTAIHRASENNPDNAFIIVNNMTEFWNVKGSFLEGLQTCLKVLDTKLEFDEILKARVLYSAGLDSSYLGRQADSENYVNQALTIFRKSGSRADVAKCLNVLGVCSNLKMEREHESMEYYNEAISIFRELGMKKDMAVTLYNISFINARKGDTELSLKNKIEALNIFKELKETHQISLLLANLGIVEFKNSNFEKARSYSEESLTASYEIGDNFLISINLINLGCIYMGLKQFEKARELLEESIVIINECGYKSNYLVALMYLGEVESKLNNDERAIELFQESIQTGREADIDYYLGSNFYNLGISYFNIKDYKNSVRHFTFLNTIIGKSSNPLGKEKLAIAEDYRIRIKEVLGNEKFEKYVNEALKFSKDEGN